MAGGVKPNRLKTKTIPKMSNNGPRTVVNIMDNIATLPPNQCFKIFIQRDFTEGTAVQFQNKFPPELRGKIEESQFEQTLTTINGLYAEAESLSSRTYCESCFACLTAYIAYVCMDTYYEKCLKKVRRYIEEQNKTVYVPRGIMLVDPVERGLRVFEIVLLNEVNHR